MASFFFDIDGTITVWQTNELLVGAIELLVKLKQDGHVIIITTKRNSEEKRKATLQMLNENKIPYDHILFGVPSPRIIINDRGAGGIHCEKNGDISKIANAINELLEKFKNVYSKDEEK